MCFCLLVSSLTEEIWLLGGLRQLTDLEKIHPIVSYLNQRYCANYCIKRGEQASKLLVTLPSLMTVVLRLAQLLELILVSDRRIWFSDMLVFFCNVNLASELCNWLIQIIVSVTRTWQEDSWLVCVGGTRLMKMEKATGCLKQKG